MRAPPASRLPGLRPRRRLRHRLKQQQHRYSSQQSAAARCSSPLLPRWLVLLAAPLHAVLPPPQPFQRGPLRPSALAALPRLLPQQPCQAPAARLPAILSGTARRARARQGHRGAMPRVGAGVRQRTPPPARGATTAMKAVASATGLAAAPRQVCALSARHRGRVPSAATGTAMNTVWGTLRRSPAPS